MLSSRSMHVLWIALFYYPTLLMIMVGFHVSVSTQTDTLSVPLPPEAAELNGTLYAACLMKPNSMLPQNLPEVNGHVLFRQQYPRGTLKVLFYLNGFPNGGNARAIHIHQYGDLSRGCDATGGHYNPDKMSHPGHPGDFGNFATLQGRIHQVIDSAATLFGELSALGRAVVLHVRMDDLGDGGDLNSRINGNSGRRLACCVIGITQPTLWNQFSELIDVETDNTSLQK